MRRWGEHRGIALSIEELKRRGAKRIGLIGLGIGAGMSDAGFQALLEGTRPGR